MRRNLPLLLALIPAASVLFLILKLSVNVLCWDEWEMVPMVEKSYCGDLHVSDFTAQYHEHRPFVSRVLILASARLTHWNTGYELGINFLLAGGIAVVLGWQILRTSRQLVWVIPLVSLTVFSLASYENWLMGWQMALFIVTLAVVGVIVLVSEPTWIRLAGAIALGWIATYSLANGMLVWPIGAVLLYKNSRMLSTWAASATLAIGLYLIGYHKPAEHPELSLNIGVVIYVLKFIGGIVAQTDFNHEDGDLAFVSGAGAIAAMGWACWSARNSVNVKPYLALSAYSLGTAILCGVGRTGLGTNQALSSRYCTLAAPFWVSLVAILGIILVNKTDRWTKTIAQWSLALVSFGLVVGSVMAISPAKEMNKVLVNARCELLALESNQQTEIVSLCPKRQQAIDGIPVLVKHHLLVFYGIRP